MIPEKGKRYSLLTNDAHYPNHSWGTHEYTGEIDPDPDSGEIYYVFHMGQYETGSFREREVFEP